MRQWRKQLGMAFMAIGILVWANGAVRFYFRNRTLTEAESTPLSRTKFRVTPPLIRATNSTVRLPLGVGHWPRR
jgi:hypothetical protein